MVKGIELFRDWFQGYENQYVIIGGTACDLLMDEAEEEFRATKDIDLVLIVEYLTPEFGKRFWEFVRYAGYEHCRKSTGNPEFYRFSNPKRTEYPVMIELFSKSLDSMILPENATLTPLPIDDSVSSLSAILLDEDYYDLLKNGTTVIRGINILDAPFIIPFKAKAWLDLTLKKAEGNHVDGKHIRKHRNDILRLSILLSASTQITLKPSVWNDLKTFIDAMEKETIETKDLKLLRSKDEILEMIRRFYIGE